MTFEGKQIGRYRIVRLLGSGAMGEVYLAEDARIEQQVAIKVIRSEMNPYSNPEQVREEERLFEREARAIAKLDHPHILPLYDYGEEQVSGSRISYLVMPFRPDGSLSDWLRRRSSKGLLSPREIAHIVGQAADALQHAHNRNVIHQDVKASNLLVRERADRAFLIDVFLTDFGVARLASGTSAISQAVRGTPSAMAPEQWVGQAVPASDQYGLAIMTYELLVGRQPFQGNLRRIMYQHINEAPAPPSTFNARVSKELDTVILRALAKKPEDRFPTITAFAGAFRQAAANNASTYLTPEPFNEEMATYIQPISSPDVGAFYTMQQAPGSVSGSNFRAQLAISADEAIRGTNRTILLPGGRQVMIAIPPGAVDGQVLQIPDPASPGFSLLITINVVKGARVAASASALEMLDTVLTQDHGASGGPQAAVRLASDRVTPLPPVAPNPFTPMPPIASNRVTPLPSTGPYRPEQSYGSLHGATTLGQEAPAVPHRAPRPSRRLLLASLAAGATIVVAGGGIGIYELLTNKSGAGTGGTQGTSGSTTIHPLGTTIYTYTGHTDFVYVVRWSPDGTRIASGGDDKTVQVWDAFTGSNPQKYSGHTSFVYGISWSPNGTLIASGSRDGTVQIWKARTAGFMLIYKGHTNWINTVDWSPNSRQIASGSTDKTLRVWDATSGATDRVYPANASNQDQNVQSVAWSHAGDRIASGDSNQVLVWSASNNETPLATYSGHTKEVRSVAWSPHDTKIASSGFDGTVHVWDSATGNHLLTYKGHSNNVNDIAWSLDGKHIVSASSDFTVQIWDALTGKLYYTYTGHTGQVQNARWSPDSRSIASGGYDNEVKVWSTGFQ